MANRLGNLATAVQVSTDTAMQHRPHGCKVFTVDRLVCFLYELRQAEESILVDAGAQNREEGKLRKQQEGRDSVVVNIRV